MGDELSLMHYGTKGMKWGVRKKSDAPSDGPVRVGDARWRQANKDRAGAAAAKVGNKVKNRTPITKTGKLLKAEKASNKKAGVKIGDAKWRQANKDRASAALQKIGSIQMPKTKTGKLIAKERADNKKAGVKVGDAKWRQANKDRASAAAGKVHEKIQNRTPITKTGKLLKEERQANRR